MKKIFYGRVLANLSLSLVAVLFSVFVIDVVIYHLSKDVDLFEVGFFQKDPKKRFALTPNFEGHLHHRAGKTPVFINSYGYRGPEWRFDAKHRFMVIGDSFAFGIPLSNEEGFIAKAEAKIGGDAAFYNLGIPGYGAWQALQSLRENCTLISPREVFYAYFLNDLGDPDIRMDYFDVVDGYLVGTYDNQSRPLGIEEIRASIGKKDPCGFLGRLFGYSTFALS